MVLATKGLRPTCRRHRLRRRHARQPLTVPPPSHWGGIYFTFNLGYGFGTSNWSDPSDPGGDDW